VPVSVGAAANSSKAAWIRWRPAEGLGKSQVALGALDGPEKNLALAAVMVGMCTGQRVMRQGRVTESNARWVREGGEERVETTRGSMW
jgi:hypothetical protein